MPWISSRGGVHCGLSVGVYSAIYVDWLLAELGAGPYDRTRVIMYEQGTSVEPPYSSDPNSYVHPTTALRIFRGS